MSKSNEIWVLPKTAMHRSKFCCDSITTLAFFFATNIGFKLKKFTWDDLVQGTCNHGCKKKLLRCKIFWVWHEYTSYVYEYQLEKLGSTNEPLVTHRHFCIKFTFVHVGSHIAFRCSTRFITLTWFENKLEVGLTLKRDSLNSNGHLNHATTSLIIFISPIKCLAM